MKYVDKSFSTYAPGDDSYRTNWDATFGKRATPTPSAAAYVGCVCGSDLLPRCPNCEKLRTARSSCPNTCHRCGGEYACRDCNQSPAAALHCLPDGNAQADTVEGVEVPNNRTVDKERAPETALEPCDRCWRCSRHSIEGFDY